MSASISALLGNAHGYARVDGDYYREPRWLVEALLDQERFAGTVLDPCCGGGNIVACLRRHGLHAIGSDKADRGFGKVQDFFDRTEPVDNICGNPPYVLAQSFAEHALHLARRKVVLLMRLAFLEGQRREHFFTTMPPARVWVSRRRASMPPGQPDGPRDAEGAIIVPPASGGSMPYAFFVWEVGQPAVAPIIGWL